MPKDITPIRTTRHLSHTQQQQRESFASLSPCLMRHAPRVPQYPWCTPPRSLPDGARTPEGTQQLHVHSRHLSHGVLRL